MNPRVAIVDDHTAMRAALRTVLEGADIVIAGEAADGDGAISLVRATRPDVVLMDVRMPGRDGISATAAIRSESPDTRVLVLTTFDDDDALAGALAAGAEGFLLKNSGPESLVRAVLQVAAGEAVLDAAVAGRVFGHFAQRARTTDRRLIDALTERELEVLALLCRGMTNAEIGALLYIGEATAKTHVSRVLAKLGVRDRVQAVIHAYESGFVD